MLDVKKIRSYFPIYNSNPDLVYLDSGASSLKLKNVIDKIDDYYNNYGVNVHRGVYKLSYDATNMYDISRNRIAKFINADKDEIIFTRGTTNSLNMVSIALRDLLNEDDIVLSSILEHHSSIMPYMENELRKKGKLKYIPLDEKRKITFENFKKVMNDKVKVIALNHVSNTMGYLTPIKEIISYARQINKDVIVVIDGAQSIPHMKIDVKDLDCDFFAFSAHKMLGPTGLGVLYGKKSILKKIRPVEFGGDMALNVDIDKFSFYDAPQKFEAGTPIIAQAIALKEACDFLDEIGFDNIKMHEQELLKYTLDKLKNISGVKVYNYDTDEGIILFNISGVHPHDAASIFDKNNICIRAGHHCAQLITKDLKTEFDATLRASFYIYNDLTDCDKFISSVVEAIDFFKNF